MKITTIAQGLIVAALTSVGSGLANASPDAREAFQPGLDTFYRLVKSYSTCPRVLGQSWSSFSGHGVTSYDDQEKEYQQGATQASLCAIASGYLVHEWLGELSKLAKAGVVKQKGLPAAAKQAFQNSDTPAFWDRFNKVMAPSNCLASTPRITIAGHYIQTIHIKCSTPLGPTTVDLNSLRVTINGRGYWNADGNYYGRNLERALAGKI